MLRKQLFREGLKLSYLDAGGDAPVLIALHAHWMEGATYAPLAAALAPRWRVIAPDQRGHGHSDHAPSYSRDDYLGDLQALLDELRLDSVVLLGNSLGGANAYQFAARHPARVRALIIEDIGAEITDDTSFALAWAGTFATRDELAARIGPRLAPYLEESFRETPAGWRLAFDPEDMVKSQKALNGDHWSDWLATRCPALLLRGADSRVTRAAHLQEMVARRPGSALRTLKGGHVLHVDDPAGFAEVVREFLSSLPGT
jgi:esterase